MERKLDVRNTIKVVTANDFISAIGLENLSLNARKLLYLVISQCRKTDKEFYEYTISIREFAELIGVQETNIYQKAKAITGNLVSLVLECSLNEKDYDQYPVFAKCSYREGIGTISIQLNPAMTDFLLNIRKDFTQPLLEDFVKMRSPYSMAIWHLMQREMKSKKPGIADRVIFDLKLDELRKVTGTEEKLKQVGQFKDRVLDKAIREIKDNCGVIVKYQNLKHGRKVIGFRFTVINEFYLSDIPEDVKHRVTEKKTTMTSRKNLPCVGLIALKRA